MSKINLLMLSIMLIAGTSLTNAAWTTPVDISANSYESRSPCLAVDYTNNNGYGKAHIVWTENSSGEWYTYYRAAQNPSSLSQTTNACSDHGLSRVGTVKSEPFIWIDPANSSTSVKPSIAFWHRNNDWYGGQEQGEILFLRDAIAIWPLDDNESRGTQYLQHLSGLQQHVKDPFIILDPCIDELMTVWSQHDFGDVTDHDLFYSYQSDSDWIMFDHLADTPEQQSEMLPYAAAFVSGDDYEFHTVSYDFAYQDNLIHSIYAGSSADCSGSWSTTYISNTSDSWFPSAAFRPSNNDLYIAYFKDNGDNTSDYYLLIFNGSTYTSYAIDDGPPTSYKVRPVVGFDTSSNLYVAYIDDDLNVMVRKRTSGGTWENPTRVDNQDSKDHSWVHLAMDPRSNKPHVVYDERNSDTDWDIMWSRLE